MTKRSSMVDFLELLHDFIKFQKGTFLLYVVLLYIFVLLTWFAIKQTLYEIFTFTCSVLRKREAKIPATNPKYKKNVFYLHIFPRKITKQVPNLSPFAIKVETWFRANCIPYEVVETVKFSKSTGQIPYLIHNGSEISDSNFILDYLISALGLKEDLSEGLSSRNIGISRAITMMIEENTITTIFLQRYVYEFSKFLKIFQLQMFWPIKKLFERSFPSKFYERARMSGIGRKSKQQVFEIAKKDIKAISDILGDKEYIMGDKLTRVDCSVFGMLSQVVFVDFHFPQMDYIKSECPNLMNYMFRIKERYWKDWDEIVQPGHFF